MSCITENLLNYNLDFFVILSYFSTFGCIFKGQTFKNSVTKGEIAHCSFLPYQLFFLAPLAESQSLFCHCILSVMSCLRSFNTIFLQYGLLTQFLTQYDPYSNLAQISIIQIFKLLKQKSSVYKIFRQFDLVTQFLIWHDPYSNMAQISVRLRLTF